MPQLERGWARRDTKPELREGKEKDSQQKCMHVPRARHWGLGTQLLWTLAFQWGEMDFKG